MCSWYNQGRSSAERGVSFRLADSRVQLCSSLLSRQSLLPSHLQLAGMHTLSLHWNREAGHWGTRASAKVTRLISMMLCLDRCVFFYFYAVLINIWLILVVEKNLKEHTACFFFSFSSQRHESHTSTPYHSPPRRSYPHSRFLRHISTWRERSVPACTGSRRFRSLALLRHGGSVLANLNHTPVELTLVSFCFFWFVCLHR